MIDRDHQRLVAAASSFIAQRFRKARHQIGAAILDGDGKVHYGLHVEAMVGRASICAEAVALGGALASGASDLKAVVAVRHHLPDEHAQTPAVVPPCGLCREVLLDYAPDIVALVPDGDSGLSAVRLADLLPAKYQGSKWRHEAAGETP